MAWIKSNQNLERNPKLFLLTQTMGWDITFAIGTLHRLWWWVMEYAEDGDLSKFKPVALANACGVASDRSNEFLDALLASSFLDKEPYLRIHDWWDHAGAYLTTKYKQRPEKHKSIQEKCLHGVTLPEQESNVVRTDKIKTDKIDEDRQKELRAEMQTIWNGSGLQPFDHWTVSRLEKLRMRLKEPMFVERWPEAINRLSKSDFARGNAPPRNAGEKPWKADIDWFLRDDQNYVKTIEGKYDNTAGDPNNKYFKPAGVGGGTGRAGR